MSEEEIKQKWFLLGFLTMFLLTLIMLILGFFALPREGIERLMCIVCVDSDGIEWIRCHDYTQSRAHPDAPRWCEVTEEYVQIDKHEREWFGVIKWSV